MNEIPNVGIGHNEPPSDANPLADRLKEKYQPQINRRDEILAKVQNIPAEVTDEDTAKRILVTERIIGDNIKEAEGLRKAEKEPFRISGQQVDSWFKAITEPLAAALKDITNRRVKFQVAAERAKTEAAEKAAREAQEAARKAQKAKEAARCAVTQERAREAEKRAQEAAQAAAMAQKAPEAKSPLRSDMGVSGGVKMEWVGAVTDPTKLDLEKLRPYIALGELEKAVQRWAKQMKGSPLAGAKFMEVPKGTRR